MLRLVEAPGNIKNASCLSQLGELNEGLIFNDIFGFTEEEFPKPEVWTKLKIMWFESIPEGVGKHIKKIFKGKVSNLDIRKLRKPEWLAENLDNPLCHWDGSSFVPKSKFKKSVVVYCDTRRAALISATDYLKDGNAK